MGELYVQVAVDQAVFILCLVQRLVLDVEVVVGCLVMHVVVQALFLCQQPTHIQYHIPLLVLIVDLAPHRAPHQVKIVHDVTDPENANDVEEVVEYMIGAQRVLLHTKSMSIAVEFVMEAVDAVFATAKVLISNNYINT